jgi:hypothetical protein
MQKSRLMPTLRLLLRESIPTSRAGETVGRCTK